MAHLVTRDSNKGSARGHGRDQYYDSSLLPGQNFTQPNLQFQHHAEPPPSQRHHQQNNMPTYPYQAPQSTGTLPSMAMRREQSERALSGHKATNFTQVQQSVASGSIMPPFNSGGGHSTVPQSDNNRQCFSDGILHEQQNRVSATKKPWEEDVGTGSERDLLSHNPSHHASNHRGVGGQNLESFLHRQHGGQAPNLYNSDANQTGFSRPFPEPQDSYNTPQYGQDELHFNANLRGAPTYNEANHRSEQTSYSQYSSANQDRNDSQNRQNGTSQWRQNPSNSNMTNMTYSSNHLIGPEPHLNTQISGGPLEPFDHPNADSRPAKTYSQEQRNPISNPVSATSAHPPVATGVESKVNSLIGDPGDDCMERISDSKYTPTASEHQEGQSEDNYLPDQRRQTIHTAPITMAVDNAHMVANHSSYHEALTGKLAENRLKLFCNYTMNCNRCYLTRYSSERDKYVLSIYTRERDTESTLHYEIAVSSQGKLQIKGKAQEFDDIEKLLEHYENNVFDARLKNIGRNCTKEDFIAAEEEKDWEQKQLRRHDDDDEDHRPLPPREEFDDTPPPEPAAQNVENRHVPPAHEGDQQFQPQGAPQQNLQPQPQVQAVLQQQNRPAQQGPVQQPQRELNWFQRLCVIS